MGFGISHSAKAIGAAIPNGSSSHHQGYLYAQVVKVREHGRVVEVNSKVVFGDPATITEKLIALPTSAVINTSYIERHNLTQRQNNRHLTRRTNGFSKKLTWFERQLWLSLAYYHFVLPTSQPPPATARR